MPPKMLPSSPLKVSGPPQALTEGADVVPDGLHHKVGRFAHNTPFQAGPPGPHLLAAALGGHLHLEGAGGGGDDTNGGGWGVCQGRALLRAQLPKTACTPKRPQHRGRQPVMVAGSRAGEVGATLFPSQCPPVPPSAHLRGMCCPPQVTVTV